MSLVEALKDRPEVRVVAAGSAATYGSGSRLREDAPLRPGTVLGASKAAASLILQMAARRDHLQTRELRLFMPYGPGEHPHRLIPHTILSALEGREIRMTEGRQQRDVVFLDDVVEAFCLAAAKPVPAGSVFNIGSGTGTPVRELVERILELMGNPVKPLMGALPTRPDEIMEMSADITAAKAHLGWEPRTTLEEGLRRTIAWWTEHRERAHDAVGAST
jgi:nucleoside-diphosphate-sugar epimerase